MTREATPGVAVLDDTRGKVRNDASVQRPDRLPGRAGRRLRRRHRPLGAGRAGRRRPVHRSPGPRWRSSSAAAPGTTRPSPASSGPGLATRRGHAATCSPRPRPGRPTAWPRPPTPAAACCSATATTPVTSSLRPGPAAAQRRRHRQPHRAGHRRHRQRPAGRDREAPRHRRRPDGLQDRRRRRRGGPDLDDVERVAATPTTAPGPSASPSTAARCPARTAPLFTVPEGRMALGLGIHGEPGIDETAMPTAAELRRTVRVAGCWQGRAGGRRPAPAWSRSSTAWARVKYEELFLLSGTSSSCSRRRARPSSNPNAASSSRASTWPGAR